MVCEAFSVTPTSLDSALKSASERHLASAQFGLGAPYRGCQSSPCRGRTRCYSVGAKPRPHWLAGKGGFRTIGRRRMKRCNSRPGYQL